MEVCQQAITVTLVVGEDLREEVFGCLFGACVGGGIVREDFASGTFLGVAVHALYPSSFDRVEALGGTASSRTVGVGGGWRIGPLRRRVEVVGQDAGRIGKETALSLEVIPGEVVSSKGGEPVFLEFCQLSIVIGGKVGVN